MILGGLDIATTTGAAMFKDGVYTTQTFRAAGKKRFLDNPKDKSFDARRMGEAGRSFEDFLTAWILSNGIEHVAIEEPLNTNAGLQRKRPKKVDADAQWAGQAVEYETVGGVNRDTFFKLYELCGIACTVCVRWNIPVEFVNQKTWRKIFLGNGNIRDPKHAAKAMCQKMGIECSSLDAAEAIGVVFYLNQKLNPYGVKRANDLFAASAG